MKSIPKANSKDEVFSIFNKLEEFNEKGINGNFFYFNLIIFFLNFNDIFCFLLYTN
jgi:hypothetical protein